MTRCSTIRSGTFSSATSRARRTWPTATRAPAAGSASRLRRQGPGATNMVTGIATAMMDSSPIVCITGQVGSKLVGSDAFQESDVTGVTLPITKHNYLVTRAEDIAPAFREAFEIAASGRPGPVHIDITKDAQQSSCEFDWDSAVAQKAGIPARLERAARGVPARARADQCRRASADSRRARHHALGRDGRRSRVRREGEHSGVSDAARHRRLPGVASPEPRHDGHARRSLGELGDSAGRPAAGVRHAVRRPRHRQPEDLRAEREEDSHRHRCGRDQQERARRSRHRRRSEGIARGPDAGPEGGRSQQVDRAHHGAQGRLRRPRHSESARQRPSVRGARHQRSVARHQRRRHHRDRRRPAPDVGSAVLPP